MCGCGGQVIVMGVGFWAVPVSAHSLPADTVLTVMPGNFSMHVLQVDTAMMPFLPAICSSST